MSAVLEVRGLVKEYVSSSERVRALDGVSFTAHSGEILAVLGPNGAGKTTLLKILLGLTQPTRGTAHICDHSVATAAARSRVGYVPETTTFPRHRSVLALLRFFGRLHGLSSTTLARRIPRVLDTVNLSPDRSDVEALSKGMKRRLALAQALLHEPDVLMLDEPTDGLDPLEREHMLEHLRTLRDQGRTLLLCSHVLAEVESVCDRYLILHQGRIHHHGSMTADTSLRDLFSGLQESSLSPS